MPPNLLLPLAGLSFACLLVLLVPLAVGIFFPIDGDRLLRNTLCRLLTQSMCEGTATMAAVVANYAFLSGMMLSLVAGKTTTALSTATSNTIPYIDAASPLVGFARHVVSMAFDQGYRLRFSWPPAQLYASSSLRPLYNSVSDSARDSLIRCVWPKLTVFIGVPLLVCLCVVCASPPSRAVGRVLRDPARLRAWLRGAVGKLRDKTQPAVDWIVDTIAPFVFGVMLVLTTSVGIVLYGIGHVGIATAARSGIFGIDLTTVRSLVWWMWRLLFRLDWSWGLRAVFGWERRHRRHQEERLHRHDEDLLLHGCGCPHRHLGDHLHDCVLRRHHYRHHGLGSELDQPWHEHHGRHHQHHHQQQQQTQHPFTGLELTELEKEEDLEIRRELLRIRLQRRGILTQTDGSSTFDSLVFGSDYRESGTQTGSPRNTYHQPSPFPASMPSPELGEIPPRQPPLRWQATVEDELEAKARGNEAQEPEWMCLQQTNSDCW